MPACPEPSSDLQQLLQSARKLGWAPQPGTGGAVVKEGKQGKCERAVHSPIHSYNHLVLQTNTQPVPWIVLANGENPVPCPTTGNSPSSPQSQPVNWDQNIWTLLMCNRLGSLSQVPRGRAKIGSQHSCLCHQGGTMQPSASDMGNSPPSNLFN